MVDTSALQTTANSVINQSDIAGLPQKIAQAIKTAAARTGVDFSYLVQKASQESGFDPNAKASSSSATGLFQFTNQTWLQMIKQHGAAYGLGNYADHIQLDSNGNAHVSDPTWKQAILDLRKDPQISAEMAGELDKTNMASLQENVGGKIGATDLYLAHFLGAGGASDFLNAMKANPNANAANVLPDAAAANPSVFYNSNGQARSLSQIYRHFAQKFDGASTTMVAGAQPSTHVSSITLASAAVPKTTSYAVASASYAASSTNAYSTYVSPVTSNIKVGTSSLMASMVLAQMNIGDIDMTTALDASQISDRNKKNLLATLSGIA